MTGRRCVWVLLLISDFLDISDSVFVVDHLLAGVDLSKCQGSLFYYRTGRIWYNPVNMLKTILFGFMEQDYATVRDLEANCKYDIRYMYLMDSEKPSYRTFAYFIKDIGKDNIEDIFHDINEETFEKMHVDLQHLYIDGTKLEANANKYTWV